VCEKGRDKIVSERERAFGRGGAVAEGGDLGGLALMRSGCRGQRLRLQLSGLQLRLKSALQSNVPLANSLRLIDMSAAIWDDHEIVNLSERGLIFFASTVRVRR
jgi:hypothetical protein